MNQTELDELALSIALRNKMTPEQAAAVKEKLKKKTSMQLAFERAKGRGIQISKEPRSERRTDR